MVHKCCVVGCSSGYSSNNDSSETIPVFHFPLKKEICINWVRFVNRANWNPTKHSVICAKHFKDVYLKYGTRTTLRWKLSPVPTVMTDAQLEKPSTVPMPTSSRKSPKNRSMQPDELKQYNEIDKFTSFEDLDDTLSPPGYSYYKHGTGNYVIYYKMSFDEFPRVVNAIKIYSDFKVKLQRFGSDVPLPHWFTKDHQARLTRKSMLINFPSYLDNMDDKYTLLEQLHKIKYTKAKGQSVYSTELIRNCLLLYSTSTQAYRILLNIFPMPSISYLRSLTKGDIDSSKALKLLKDCGDICDDIILMVDEMYLQKSVQYHGGNFVGMDEEGNLYKGIVAIMLKGLKKSLSFVYKVLPETEIHGYWLAEQLMECLIELSVLGFKVRAIVSDNHQSNVNAFSNLISQFGTGSDLYIVHPSCNNRTYLFFDNVHLVKNIRNNLLNAKKFVFPSFAFSVNSSEVSSNAGYISWHDLHLLHEKDQHVACNLRKAPKLTVEVLHPGNKKQNVNLALGIIHESTIAASTSYFPERTDVSGFLKLIHTWWTIVNCRQRYSPNRLGNAIVAGDDKIDFLESFVEWLVSWRSSDPSKFCFTKQTFNALIKTLQAQTLLVRELLSDGFEFVVMGKLQSDPLERRFSQYRQMSGGRFLVGLREVLSSEKILKCKSMLKSGIKFWKEDVKVDSNVAFKTFEADVDSQINDLGESTISDDTAEVAYVVSGFIAKTVGDNLSCSLCSSTLIGNANGQINTEYFCLLSRGGLTAPSLKLEQFVSNSFAILDSSAALMSKHSQVPSRKAALHILNTTMYGHGIGCSEHQQRCINMVLSKVVNVYFNNKQKLKNSAERKEAVKEFKRRQRQKV